MTPGAPLAHCIKQGNSGDYRAIRYHHEESNAEDQPELNIVQRLENLSNLEMFVADPRVVFFHARNCNVSLPVAEPSCSNRIWRHCEENNDGPEYGDGASYDVHILPAVQTAATDMAKTVVDQRGNRRYIAGGRVLFDVNNVTSGLVKDSYPSSHTKCLLLLLVPAADYKLGNSQCDAR
jgi:hypothetical protein